MATILQCKFCNMPFQSLGGKLCPNCLDQIDEDFTKIRDFMYDNPGTFDVDAICEGADVKKRVVMHLIHEKRLVISAPEGKGAYACSICKKPISEGTMCEDCSNSLAKTIGDSVAAKKPPKMEKNPLTTAKSGARMHIKPK